MLVKRTAISCWVISLAALLVGACLYLLAWTDDPDKVVFVKHERYLLNDQTPITDHLDDSAIIDGTTITTAAEDMDYRDNMETCYEVEEEDFTDNDEVAVYDEWWKTVQPQINMITRKISIEVVQFQLAEILFKNETFYWKSDKVSDDEYRYRWVRRGEVISAID